MVTVVELRELPPLERIGMLSGMSKEQLKKLVLERAKEIQAKYPEFGSLSCVRHAIGDIIDFELPEGFLTLPNATEKMAEFVEVRRLMEEIEREYEAWWEGRRLQGLPDIKLVKLKKLPPLFVTLSKLIG